MQIQMTSDVLYIKSCLCGSLGRARDVDEAFERQRKQMPAANGLKWKTNLLMHWCFCFLNIKIILIGENGKTQFNAWLFS